MPALELEVYLNYLLPWGSEHAHLYKSVTTIWTTREGQRGTINEAVKSYDDLVQLIETRQQWKSADVYLAMGTQRVADTKQSRDGLAMYAIRRANNMATFNALFVDVDVGPNDPKKYPTIGEALKGADAFYATTGLLPPNMRVHSGSGGFHDFWCFAKPLEKDEWLRYAEALKRAAEHHGFRIDMAVTADAARILRVPTTLNHKHKPPRPCKLDIPVTKGGRPYHPDEITAAVRAFMEASKKTGTGPSATVSSIGANFSEGVDQKRPPVPIDQVAVNCPMTAQTLADGGKGKSEPEWQMDIYLAAFTSDPLDAAYRLSNGHAEYEHDKMLEKLKQKQTAIKAHDLGWPDCTKFHHVACNTCPLRKLGKSPLHFAQPDVPPIQPTTQDDEIMPPGYFRNRDNHVIREVDGRYLPVIPYPILDAFIDAETGEPIIKYGARDKENFGVVSLTRQSPAGIAEAWTKATQMYLNPKTLGPFQMSFVQRLHQLGNRRTMSPTAMGWDRENFVFDEVYMPNGSKAVYRQRDIIDLNYRREGELEPWQEAMEMVYGNTVLEILAASAFAAPLVSLVAPYSVILSVYSPASAFGKTTAISLAQAVWAQPEKMSQVQDTTNSVMGKLAALRHLPLYWDELKLQSEMEEIVKIVFRVISGRDKTRMKQDASLRKQAQAARTMMAVCSNQSVMAMAQEATEGTDAGGVRVFELQADPLIKKPGVHGEGLLLPLDNNYGVVGSLYARYLVRNRKAIAAILTAVREGMEAELGFEDRERFWKTTMVTIVVGAMLANAAKLTRFNIQAMRERLVQTLHGMRVEHMGSQTHATTTTDSATGIFNQMFNELIGTKMCFVSDIIESPKRGRRHGKDRPSASQNMAGGTQADYKEIVAQQGREDGKRLIRKTFFHDWMSKHHRQAGQIKQLLQGEYMISESRRTLCSGIYGFHLSQLDCYEFVPINRNPSDPSASSD